MSFYNAATNRCRQPSVDETDLALVAGLHRPRLYGSGTWTRRPDQSTKFVARTAARNERKVNPCLCFGVVCRFIGTMQ